MDAIIIEQRIKELTKAAGQIKREDLPEIRDLCGKIYSLTLVQDVINPLLTRIEVLEETLDQFEKIRKAEEDLRKAKNKTDFYA